MKFNGPGKYDDVCTQARNAAGASGAVLMIYGGRQGDGFEVQLPAAALVRMPDVLRRMADQIEAQLAGGQPA